MVEIEPYTKILWKSKRDREIWSRRIQEASRLYYYCEYRTFEIGLRDVIVYHLHLDDKLEQSILTFNKHDIVFYPIRRSKMYSGFSHRHLSPSKNDPQFIYGCIAYRRNQDKAIKFYEASVDKVDHRTIGKLLGYPECCIDFFVDNWSKVSIDPMYEIATNSEGATINDNRVELSVHPFTNQMLRYFGLRITPHLPCSFTCERTIELGKTWFEIMKEKDRTVANWLLDLLSMETEWNCYKGISIVDTPIFKGVTNSDSCLKKKIVTNLGWNGSV